MTITPEALARQLEADSSPFLLDVRTAAEFREMAIPGSISMPLDQLDPQRVKTMATDHSPCVVVCYSGKRSEQACSKLNQAGVEGVASLEGGLELWERKDLPLERRSGGGLSIIRQVQIVVGLMVVLGVVLTVTVSPWWAILPGFFGAGLLFAGLSGFCGLGLVLAKMPWNKL